MSEMTTKAGTPRKRAPGGGRKPSASGYGAPLSLRVTPETRVALEQEAARRGVKLSRVVEAAIVDGLRGRHNPEEASQTAYGILSGWVGDDRALYIIQQIEYRGLMFAFRDSQGDAKDVDA